MREVLVWVLIGFSTGYLLWTIAHDKRGPGDR